MASSDTHLEKALVEFNTRVDELEDAGPSADLVDALVKRSRVLAAMDFGVSADEDLDEALEVLDGLLSQGVDVQADICFRTYVALGISRREVDDAEMHTFLIKASRYLRSLSDPVSAARACVDCAYELMDLEDIPSARAFLNTALCLRESTDPVQRNYLLKALFLYAESYVSSEQYAAALPYLVEAVDVGSALYGQHAVREPLDLVLSYVYLADTLIATKDDRAARANLDAVSSILEEKDVLSALDQSDVGEIHGQIGKDYVELGDVETAERHLLKQAAFSLSGEDPVLREAIERRMGSDE